MNGGKQPGFPAWVLLAAHKHASRGGGTFVPVRKNVPIHRVVEVLRKDARQATDTRRQKNDG